MYGASYQLLPGDDRLGINLWTSSDLNNWDGPFVAFRPPDGFWGTRDFWAPEVHEYRGAYYMFATFYGCDFMRGTAILKADNPKGPFVPWSDGAVTPKDQMCLDGTLFMDENGEPWMVYCHEWLQIYNGTICAIKLDKDLTHAVSEPLLLFASQDTNRSKMVSFDGNEGYVTDAPFFYRTADGTLLTLWSYFGDEGYCLSYAVSETCKLPGPWRQAEKPLFTKDGGHGMIFTAYDGRLMLALHQPNIAPDERAMFIELKEIAGGLTTV